MGDGRMGEATREARQAIAEARRNLARETDELAATTRSSLDIPAKVRRNPVRTVGLGVGAVFLALNGPTRTARAVARRLRRRPPAPRRLLPEEIERAVDGLGKDAPAMKARLEREFGKYLEKKKKDPAYEPTLGRSLLGAFDAVSKPLGALAAKRLGEEFFAPRRDRPPDAAEAGAAPKQQADARRDREAGPGGRPPA